MLRRFAVVHTSTTGPITQYPVRSLLSEALGRSVGERSRRPAQRYHSVAGRDAVNGLEGTPASFLSMEDSASCLLAGGERGADGDWMFFRALCHLSLQILDLLKEVSGNTISSAPKCANLGSLLRRIFHIHILGLQMQKASGEASVGARTPLRADKRLHTDRVDESLFRLGFGWLEHLLKRGLLLTCTFSRPRSSVKCTVETIVLQNRSVNNVFSQCSQ